ncbi:KpsF/GutQ family sugar-phosphate isomerase [Amantichitinum ursilacus]|uniref:Arabinose 5-phosphate isomerase KdsD n=1 Tax=Amantichitinum ursilacus TaxID=857265 RepID=A0A0N0XKC3_9NEIS|nr:KpsF/GutQ family sugar-phosphate isomerase [Amantichitinum ursilacus]KPC54049.1 Arabinose 5-phosphate isomerase KdsD [Amantichitinum ursilacus]
MSSSKDSRFIARARRVLSVEAAALDTASARIDASFAEACELLLACKGRVAVTGMGKSGHVARKIAATLSSTGTPALFLHPGEAAHGDLGMVTPQDVVLALSYSGESDELLAIVPSLKRLGVPIIALTGNRESTLGREARVWLDASVAQEACPLNLAPTASTTVALALGDALAVALLEERGFGAEDFAQSHPGGSLGRRLLIHVADIMRHGDALPVVHTTTTVRDALMEISRKGLGMTAVLDEQHNLVGIFTDGDLRRALDRNVDVHQTCVADVMTNNPVTIEASRLAAEAVLIMESRRIGALLVMQQGRLTGALNMHDLLQARVV